MFLAHSIESKAKAHLWLPRMSLASCVRAVVSRDTLGLALSDAERYSHFAATPACAITWLFSGQADMLPPGAPTDASSPRTPLPGPVVFSGPHSQPFACWNPGPAHMMMLLLMPDALSALTGIDPGDFLNEAVPAHEVLDAHWMGMCHAVQAAPDDAQRLQRIEDFIAPLWQQHRPATPLGGRLYADWSQGVALRAATSGIGRSVRQAERRIKLWTGQPLRELRGLGKVEQAFIASVEASEQGALNWPDLASDAGFADQSHLCRQTRRITGFAPDALRRGIASDESFWVYRLWGFSEGAG
jgi:AraC-like DNA-binding protein